MRYQLDIQAYVNDDVWLRNETAKDAAAISHLITRAFANARHSSGTESAIVDSLRNSGGLSGALVAEKQTQIVGFIALSPISVAGWHGIGPVCVDPDHQGQGIGSALIGQMMMLARKGGAAGVVVLGEPDYYNVFGFKAEPRLTLPGVPPEYFMALPFTENIPETSVRYHVAFGET